MGHLVRISWEEADLIIPGSSAAWDVASAASGAEARAVFVDTTSGAALYAVARRQRGGAPILAHFDRRVGAWSLVPGRFGAADIDWFRAAWRRAMEDRTRATRRTKIRLRQPRPIRIINNIDREELAEITTRIERAFERSPTVMAMGGRRAHLPR
jgi:hypothetical protein